VILSFCWRLVAGDPGHVTSALALASHDEFTAFPFGNQHTSWPCCPGANRPCRWFPRVARGSQGGLKRSGAARQSLIGQANKKAISQGSPQGSIVRHPTSRAVPFARRGWPLLRCRWLTKRPTGINSVSARRAGAR